MGSIMTVSSTHCCIQIGESRQEHIFDCTFVAMLLYNITTKIDHQSHAEWLNWMETAYLPHIMECGALESYKLARLRGVDESDGITYALILGMANMPTFRVYQEKFALAHQTMHDTRYKEHFVSFRSVLDVMLEG